MKRRGKPSTAKDRFFRALIALTLLGICAVVLVPILNLLALSLSDPKRVSEVTGLTVKDFELLVSLGVFNSNVMNQAVFGFKRYEDASLTYTGINKHEGEDIGLWETVLSRKEGEATFVNDAVRK